MEFEIGDGIKILFNKKIYFDSFFLNSLTTIRKNYPNKNFK